MAALSRPNPESILILKTCEVGDLIMTTPVAEALRLAYPKCHIAWLVEDKMAEPILGNPFLDEVLVMPRSQMRQLRQEGRRRELRRLSGEFRALLARRKYDYLIDLQGFRRTVPIHGMARAKHRIFLPGKAKWTHYGPYLPRLKPLQHAVDYHLDAVRAGGLAIAPGAPPMRVTFSEEDEAAALNILAPRQSARPLAAIHPLSPRPTKNWSIERHIELARRLITNLDAQVVIIGGPNQAGACRELAESIGPGAWSTAGATSLKQLAALLTHCACLVTNDSGPMHLAAAVETPVIGIFGATHPQSAAPRGDRHTAIYEALPCSPCLNLWERDPACMKAITVERVYRAVENRVSMNTPRGRLIPVSALLETARTD